MVPKKSRGTNVQNERGEDVPTRLTIGWRVCIDYRGLNVVTRKDHFLLPFIDQLLERVSGYPFYCFLDGYFGYFQIEIVAEDQEKTTFTCPFRTYAYRRMPFGVCNAPATFQIYMLSIFSDMVERIMEVYMDDITIYGGTFEECLANLETVLHRCIEKNLVLDSCHSRYAKSTRLYYDWIDMAIWLPIPAKTIKIASECDQKYNRDPNMSIGLIITVRTQKAQNLLKIGLKIALITPPNRHVASPLAMQEENKERAYKMITK